MVTALLSARRDGLLFSLNGETLAARGGSADARSRHKGKADQIRAEMRGPYIGSWLDLTVEQMLSLAQGSGLRGYLKRVDAAGRRTGGRIADALAVADEIGAEGVRLAKVDHLPGVEGADLVAAIGKVFSEREVDVEVFAA